MRHRERLGALIVGLMLVGCQGRPHSALPGYSAAGLYDLANAYAHAGRPGMAVLNYERASLLAPNDPDIEFNLRYVLQSRRLPLEPRGRMARALSAVSPMAVSWIGVAGLVIVGASLLGGRRTARYRWLRRGALLAGILLVGLTVGNAVLLWPKLHEAVVIRAAAPVRVSPVPMGDALIVLPEAAIVRMRAQHEGFVLVETSAGLAGWASRADLAPVVPLR